jgi:hypothetical protein
MAMRKVNTRGLELAHKCMLLAAMAYNLQKFLRFTPKTSQTAVMALPREEQGMLFWLFFVGGEEGILRKGIRIRRYLRVVQQPHSSLNTPIPHNRCKAIQKLDRLHMRVRFVARINLPIFWQTASTWAPAFHYLMVKMNLHFTSAWVLGEVKYRILHFLNERL